MTDWSNMSACELAERQWDASFKNSSSRPKKNFLATERDTERVQMLRVQYWQEIGAVNLKDLVFEGWNRLQFGNDFGVMLAP